MATARNGDGHEQPKQARVAKTSEKDKDPGGKDKDLEEIDFEKLGREVLELIRRYAERTKAPQGQRDARNDKVKEYQDQR